jgi:serine/threonine protein kinase
MADPVGMSIAAEDWLALSQLLEAALLLQPGERASWIEQLEGDHQRFRYVLRDLLSSQELAETGRFLSTLPKIAGPQAWIVAQIGPGDLIGPYRLLRAIGAGGMGSVWLAERSDGLLKRKVALKLPHAGGAVAGLGERMARERNILAALEHPNIARLYDAGLAADGRPYLALEYVEGQPIDGYCAAARLGIPARLALVQQVARAVAYAHAHLVVHRDLKPSNIHVDAEGQVHLLDFGIAKLLDHDPAGQSPPADKSPTQTVGAVLTPQYASPEQIRGEPVSTASDVYSLGVVLYELLAGKRPYELKGTDAFLLGYAIQSIEPSPPSEAAIERGVGTMLKGDLDTIVLKAMKKAPAERYATVAEMGDDIARFLRGEPVTARPDSTWYRTRKFVARNKLVVASVAAVVAALAGGLGVVSWQAHRIAVERDIARGSATREEAVRYYLTNLFRTSVAEHGPEPTTAKTMLDRSAQQVLHEYRDDPYLAGKVVETLSDLYTALEDVEGERPLLEGFLAQAGARADPEALAYARQKLAGLELLRGNVARAASLLDSAERFWATSPQLYREQRLQGLAIRGRLQRAQGDLAGSVTTQETAIRERVALSGLNDRETAHLYNSLAITLTALNRFDAALQAYRQSLAIYQALGKSEDIDALIMVGNTGALALRFGRLAEGEQLLRTAFEKERAVAGDSAAVAASMGSYGLALNSQARYADALQILRRSTAMAERFTGAATPLTVQNRLGLADALWNTGERRDALTLLGQNLELASKHYGDGDLVTLRVRLQQAQFAASEGRPAIAQAQLAELIPPLRKLGPAVQIALAEALVAQGDALLAQSRAADAVAPLTEAVKLREQLLWEQSWALAEARERLGEALGATGDARGRALLQRAQSTLRTQLGASHPQTLRAARALAT